MLDGGQALFGHETNYPSIVLIEVNYRASLEAGQPNPVETLFKLYNLGYTKISHAGPICKRRWKAQSRGIFPISLPFGQRANHSTWCSLNPEQFNLFLRDKHSSHRENVIFYKERDWSLDKQLLHGNGNGSSSLESVE